MGALTVPPNGLLLSHNALDKNSNRSSSAQALRLDLNTEQCDTMLRSLKNLEKSKISFGKNIILHLGHQTFPLSVKTSSFPSEIYSLSNQDKNQPQVSGKVSHEIAVRLDEASKDPALAALENSLKSIQDEKVSNEASFVRNFQEMDAHNKKSKAHKSSHLQPLHSTVLHRAHLFNGVTKSTPNSPFLGPSPSLGPTSNPLLSSGSSLSDKDRQRLNAMRVPLVHLLAAGPKSTTTLAQAVRAPVEDVERVLAKVATDDSSQQGNKVLKDKAFRELNVWRFPYADESTRQVVIKHAIHAFDRMRVGSSDQLWQMLLKPEERGKGKVLSRLNFDRPMPRAAPLESTADDESSGRTDLDHIRGRASTKPSENDRARSNDPLHRKKVSEKETWSKRQLQKDALNQIRTIRKERSQMGEGRAKSTMKYKSSEIVVDSDEGEALSSMSGNSDGVRHRNSQKSVSSQSTRMTNSQSSHSSKASHSSIEAPSSMPTSKRHNHKPADHSRRQDQAPIVDPSPQLERSDPQRPASLASSPPNSSDLDNSSSEAAASLSSMTSSPPSGTEVGLIAKSSFSPVVGHNNNGPSVASDSRKRKASDVEADGDQPKDGDTSKRRRQNGPTTEMEETKHAEPDSRPNGPKRKATDSSSGSGSSLSSGRPDITQAELLEKARRFQLYYNRYETLHGKLYSIPIQDREEDEIRQLWKMHRRVTELKAEIWDDWVKMGKPEEMQL